MSFDPRHVTRFPLTGKCIERYNKNLCTFLSQPVQNKQVHHGGTFLLEVEAFLTNLAVQLGQVAIF